MSEEQTFLNKSDDEIKFEIFKLALDKTGLKNLKSTGPFRGFLEVLVTVVSALYSKALNNIFNNSDLDRATGFWLSLWGVLFGLERKSALKATGVFKLKSYMSGTLQKGAFIYVSGTSLRFKVLETVAFLTGEYNINVEAEFSGSNYNIPEGTAVALKKVVAGVEYITLPSDWIQIQGTEEEKDDPYRLRIKAKWLSIGDGNPPSKFELVASSVSGIKETKVIRCPRGQGTTDLYISSESGEKIASLKEEVEEKIDLVGLVCRDLLVKWPEDLKTNYLFQFSGEYTEEEIELSIRFYILNIPMGGIFEERKLYSYIESKFPALTRFEIVEPVRDVSASGTSEKVERIIPPLADDPDGFYFKVVKV